MQISLLFLCKGIGRIGNVADRHNTAVNHVFFFASNGFLNDFLRVVSVFDDLRNEINQAGTGLRHAI